jgi:hypothetical protein
MSLFFFKNISNFVAPSGAPFSISSSKKCKRIEAGDPRIPGDQFDYKFSIHYVLENLVSLIQNLEVFLLR